MDDKERNGLQEIIDTALEEMAVEAGDGFDPARVNLAEFCRRTGLTRSKARTIKKKGFKVGPHGRCGMRAKSTVLTGFTETLGALLRQGVTNSSVCLSRIAEQGYKGGLTSVKTYIASHMNLVLAARKLVVEPQGNRGRRYQTGPGESYQMDWGFVNAEGWTGEPFRVACFAMVCHHCGTPYVEFFPNARQENLIIGMLHAFMQMGVPKSVLTDNMKSVVVRRDVDGKPVWQKDYARFMSAVGFKTKLCKPRHPFTKGKVERLIRFVKGNFLAGRTFEDLTQLNDQALLWCEAQSAQYHRALACVPAQVHDASCLKAARPLEHTDEVAMYLCPERKISFDGFVSYKGRRFGVPWWYQDRTCRVSREGRFLHVYSADLTRELVVHEVTWSRLDSFCEDQFADVRPAETPSVTPTTTIRQSEPTFRPDGFKRFNFEGRAL